MGYKVRKGVVEVILVHSLKGAMHVLGDEHSLGSEDSPCKGPGQDCAWGAGETWGRST